MPKDLNTMFLLQDKVAVVTGASRGIGAEIARLIASAGARVVLCSRKQEAVGKAADTIAKAGGQVLPVAANIANAGDRNRLLHIALEWGGRLDVLINNAGANPYFGGLEDVPEAALDKILDVNFKAPLFLSQMAYKMWMEAHGGVILNVSSVGGLQCTAGINAYNTVKAALNHLTRCLAGEWGAQGVRVNALAPGLIKTDFSKVLWDNPDSDDLIGHLPIPRFGEVEDVAGAALFLVSGASAYITGHTLVIDGGMLLKA